LPQRLKAPNINCINYFKGILKQSVTHYRFRADNEIKVLPFGSHNNNLSRHVHFSETISVKCFSNHGLESCESLCRTPSASILMLDNHRYVFLNVNGNSICF
jgi:hypothetical protein